MEPLHSSSFFCRITFHTGAGHFWFQLLCVFHKGRYQAESTDSAQHIMKTCWRRSSSLLFSLVTDGQLEAAASVDVHRAPDMQQHNCITSREVFFSPALLDEASSFLVAFASVPWCASVVFLLLGRTLFSPVIRMPASSTASFTPLTTLRAKLRAGKLFSGGHYSFSSYQCHV